MKKLFSLLLLIVTMNVFGQKIIHNQPVSLKQVPLGVATDSIMVLDGTGATKHIPQSKFVRTDQEGTFTEPIYASGQSGAAWDGDLVANLQYLYDNYQSISESGIAGEDVTSGQIMYQGVDDKWYLADADDVTHVGGRLAYCVVTALLGELTGVTNQIAHNGSSWTTGDRLYLSNTAGGVLTAPPGTGYARIIGATLQPTTRYYYFGSPNYVAVNGSNVNGVTMSTGSGTIGGSITNTQLAFGNVTANDIQGTSNLTWDGTDIIIQGASSTDGGIQFGDGTGLGELRYDTTTDLVILESSNDLKLQPDSGNTLVNGNLEVSLDPTTDLQVGDRGYNDGRYAAYNGGNVLNMIDVTNDYWDSDWTLATGATDSTDEIDFVSVISASTLNVAGIEPSDSGWYMVTINISAYTSGTVSVRVGTGEQSVGYADGAGWWNILAKAGSASDELLFAHVSAFTGTIDYASVTPTTSPYIEDGQSTASTSITPSKSMFHTGYTYYTTSSSAITLNLTTTILASENQEIEIVQMGTGAITIDGGAGTTVNGVSAGNVVIEQYTKATIRQLATASNFLVTEEKIGGAADLVTDLSPQLGADLDTQGYSIEMGTQNSSIGTDKYGTTTANVSYMWFSLDEIFLRSHDNSTGANYGQVGIVYDDFAGLRMQFSDVGNTADGTINYFGLGDGFIFEDVDVVSFGGAETQDFRMQTITESTTQDIAASDISTTIFANAAGATTYTIPDTLTEDEGAHFTIIAEGAGTVTITTSGTTTINGSTSFDIVVTGVVANKINGVQFIQKGDNTDDWICVGAY